MTWIDTISYEESDGELRKLYDRIKGPNDNVDNIMLAHSLRLHTMVGHMTLYKYVLHHPRNNLPKAYKELAGLRYAAKLTTTSSELGQSDIESLRAAGFEDGEILEINQVTAYFAYANRTVLGLGINTEGDIIGLSPGDSTDPDNWSHQ